MIPTQLHSRAPGLPILAARLNNGAITWFPKAEEGNQRIGDGVTALGVWGGTVATYSTGFNTQPVWLTFAAIDVDGTSHAQNTHVTDLPARVAELLPDAYVRTSKSGTGAHAFIILESPIRCVNRIEALHRACAIAAPYAETLKQGGVTPDIVGRNMLWVWSVGGQQRDVSPGKPVNVDVDTLPVTTNNTPRRVVSGGSVSVAALGPYARNLIETLIKADVIEAHDGTVGAVHRLHLRPVLDALNSTPWRAMLAGITSPGTDLQTPNCTLQITPTAIALYSFALSRVVLSVPTKV